MCAPPTALGIHRQLLIIYFSNAKIISVALPPKQQKIDESLASQREILKMLLPKLPSKQTKIFAWPFRNVLLRMQFLNMETRTANRGEIVIKN